MAPASVSVVYAVNTLHAARDLGFTLGGSVAGRCRPGGRLVISECVPPPEPIYADFVFNLTETFRVTAPRSTRYRPRGGFLGLEDWTAAWRRRDSRTSASCPTSRRIRVEVPDWSVAAIGASVHRGSIRCRPRVQLRHGGKPSDGTEC